MKSKYKNVKTEYDGHKFDSKKEAIRYAELKALQLAGEIDGLELQPRFELVPKVRWNNRTLRKREYVADFKYYEVYLSRWVVEDVKGYRTDVYKLKRSLFLFNYPEYLFRES